MLEKKARHVAKCIHQRHLHHHHHQRCDISLSLGPKPLPLPLCLLLLLLTLTLLPGPSACSDNYGRYTRERKISLSGRKHRLPPHESLASSKSNSNSNYQWSQRSSTRHSPDTLMASSSSSAASSSAASSSRNYGQLKSSAYNNNFNIHKSNYNNNNNNYNNNKHNTNNKNYNNEHSAPRHSTTGRGSGHKHSHRRRQNVRSSMPNVVVIMTDDQDVLLGSLKYMPKVQRLLIRQGAYFNNSFVPTPMCCPSRSTFLTGLYVHNHNVYTNNGNCSSTMWQQLHETRTFATYVNHTHNTAYFGKYLNEYHGTHTPPGWHRWVGLIKNSRFYNYSVVDETGMKTKHDDNYYKDYLTNLVANDSMTYLHESKMKDPSKPVMMVLSVPAPHGPEDAAPQYQHMFVNNTDHRTPAWNFAPNPDKQWLLQITYPMMPQYKLFTDLLQRRRLQTLQSVDDMVEKVVDKLDSLGELDNTYIIYTSDHGYHLGQFGLIKGKAMPFDFDTRVPLIIRGPGIRPGTVISNIVSNVDMAPTLIDIAGHDVPEHMDGQSMLRLIKAAKDASNVDKNGFVKTKRPWKDTILLERGKLSEKIMKQRMRIEEMIIFNQMAHKKSMHFYIPPRTRKLALECSKEENRLPCKVHQKWYCVENNGRLRKHKCRSNRTPNTSGTSTMIQDQAYNRTCSCDGSRGARKLGKTERRRQRRFLKRHVSRNFKPKFLRSKRSLVTDVDVGTSAPSTGFSGFEAMFNRRCRILANQSILCDLDIYQKASEWESHKERIDDMIKEYRKALEDLRDIRRHLRRQKPLDALDDDDDVDDEEYPYEIDGKDDWAGRDNDEDCDCDRWRSKDKEDRIEARLKRRKIRKQRRRRKNDECNSENMNCFTHNNDHWKTPPYWHYGPFCFCSNANNNTYWCLRTINQTHDFLYCEFITTFMSFYDLKTDPFQLTNIVTQLNYGLLQQLHEELQKLKHCSGGRDCTMTSSQKEHGLPHDPDWPGLIHLQRSSQAKYRDGDDDGTHVYEDDDREYYDDFIYRPNSGFSEDMDYE